MQPGQFNAATGPLPQNLVSMYKPNQHVICTGIAIRYQPSIVRTVTGRNLNSGHSIWLLVRSTFTDTSEFQPVYHVFVRLNFAITY